MNKWRNICRDFLSGGKGSRRWAVRSMKRDSVATYESLPITILKWVLASSQFETCRPSELFILSQIQEESTDSTLPAVFRDRWVYREPCFWFLSGFSLFRKGKQIACFDYQEAVSWSISRTIFSVSFHSPFI